MIRKLSPQHARKAVVSASLPLRRFTSSAALPQVSSTSLNRPIWGIRETGDFTPVPVDFGEVMPVRPYDQSTVVVKVEGCTFRNLHAFDSEQHVLYERQLPFGELPVALQKLEPVKHEYENVAYLSNTLPGNFYHWLLLVLPMLRFYESAGVELDRLYVGEPLRNWQLDSLDYFGIDAERIVTDPCSANTGYVAVITRDISGVPPAQVEWARKKFVPEEPPKGHRRLFVGRGDGATRQMFGEAELAAELEREFGFEYLTTAGMTLADEIGLFGQADVVVAPYGAALTNLLFAPRGTAVLELQAFDNDFSIVHCYQEMGAIFGNPHAMLRGEPTPRRKKGVFSDILISRDLVMREVEKMMVQAT